MSNSIDLTSWFTDSSEEKTEKNKEKDRAQFLEQKLGVTKMMNCGLKATVIAYRGCRDIDVRFENGNIVSHKQWENFKRGNITYTDRNDYCKTRVGITKTMLCGLKATIIVYRNCRDIDIQFENNVIATHKTWYAFMKGSIACRDSNGKEIKIKHN